MELGTFKISEVKKSALSPFFNIFHAPLNTSTLNFLKKSLVKMPKGFLRDSGLIHYLLDITTKERFLRSPRAGWIFESFVIEEILKGLSLCSSGRWNYSHYRTKNGAEIDLILEGDFGLLPVEIKFSSHVDSRGLISLKQFIKEYDPPFGLVINHSREVKMLSEKILQIPAGFI